MKSFRRVTTPKKSPINPKFAIGGLDPDEYGKNEWTPEDGDCLISSQFSRLDSRLENDQLPIRPFPDREKTIYPKPNPKRTAELNQMIRQLTHKEMR